MLRTSPLQLAPSLLTADFGHLADEIDRVVMGGADLIHVDIMDGQFVPNMSMGPCVVKALRGMTDLPLDVHLMILNPEVMIPAFAKAGADSITVHAEVCPQLFHTVSMIHDLGLRAGVALNPGTPVGVLDAVLPELDMIDVMTVNPGFGGQKFIPSSPEKIRLMRSILEERGLSCDIQVDGGVNASTLQSVVEAGANVLVVGSAIFDGRDAEGNARAYRRMLDEMQ